MAAEMTEQNPAAAVAPVWAAEAQAAAWSRALISTQTRMTKFVTAEQ